MRYVVYDKQDTKRASAYSSELEIIKRFGDVLVSMGAPVGVEIWIDTPNIIPEAAQLNWGQFLEYYERHKSD